MKHFLFLLVAVMALTVSTQLQAQTALTPVTDTLTDAGTRNLTIKISGAYNDVLTFQLNVVKINGTTAGSAYVQGSLDGVNYFTLPGTDTLTLTNGNNFKGWVAGKSNYLFYRVHVVGSGTQSTQLKAWALFR